MFGGIVGLVSGAAKSLFSGEARAARKERKEVKKEAKEKAKEVKEAAKAAITGGAAKGAKASLFFTKAKEWFIANWQIVAIVVGAAAIIWFLFFNKKKGGAIRRRRSSGKGTSSMKARMAKVRAARKRKR